MEAKAILGDQGLSAQLEVETRSGAGHRARYSQLMSPDPQLGPTVTRTMGEHVGTDSGAEVRQYCITKSSTGFV